MIASLRTRIGMSITALGLVLAACTPGGYGADALPSPPEVTSSQSEPPAATTPIARAYAVMADMPGEGVILFSGQFGVPPGTPLSDLWSFDPDSGWEQIAAETGHGSDAWAYDSRAEVLVSVEDPDTWTFDPSTGEWRSLDTKTRPRNTWGTRIAYDAGSDRIILFGGLNGASGTLSDQTWALDLDAGQWERMHPKMSPPPQNFHAMAYDSDADRVILFSGHGQQGTWAYDYDTDTWTDLAPESRPEALDYTAMVYDQVGKRTILFGGVDTLEEPFGDTWTYDFARNTWTKLGLAKAPSPRGWHSMAFDAETRVIVMFSGGETRDTNLDDVWLFDPATDTWSQAE